MKIRNSIRGFLIVLFLLPFACYSQVVDVVTEQEYDNASFSSLMFLKEELQGVKVIGLGESTHWLKQTYISKIKMVKFLHQYCGFDVIAFEAPIYNLHLVNERLVNGIATTKDFRRNNSGVWNFDELVELYEYIIETQKSDKPLIYAGIDESFFKAPKLKEDYKAFVDSLARQAGSKFTLDSTFYNALERTANNSYSYRKIPPADTLLLHDKLNLIKTTYAALEEKDVYFLFWNRLTENLQGLYRKSYNNTNRDENMAANVSFLSNELYPNKKIMLWAATTHLIDNASNLNLNRESHPRMGHFLKEEFGDAYYIMAFSPYTGKGGVKGYLGLMTRKVRTKKNSIEKHINDEYNCDYAYVSLRDADVKGMIQAEGIKRANIVGLKSREMNIPEIVDGIFYMRKEAVLQPR